MISSEPTRPNTQYLSKSRHKLYLNLKRKEVKVNGPFWSKIIQEGTIVILMEVGR